MEKSILFSSLIAVVFFWPCLAQENIPFYEPQKDFDTWIAIKCDMGLYADANDSLNENEMEHVFSRTVTESRSYQIKGIDNQQEFTMGKYIGYGALTGAVAGALIGGYSAANSSSAENDFEELGEVFLVLGTAIFGGHIGAGAGAVGGAIIGGIVLR